MKHPRDWDQATVINVVGMLFVVAVAGLAFAFSALSHG